MAKRKKKGSAAPKSNAPKAPASALANQLSAWRKDREPEADAPPAAPVEPPRPHKPDPRNVTAEALMEEAFNAVSAGSHAAKFMGRGYDAGDVEVQDHRPRSKRPAADATPKAQDVSADDLMFYELMTGGDVQALASADPVQPLREKEWAGLHWHDTVQLSRMSAEELHEPTLTPAQRDLLKRSRRAGAMDVINLRRLTEREALGEVQAVVHEARRKGTRFVRVVTGKGKQSKGDPVLKRAVIDWTEGEGERWVRAWAPETDLSGRYGSVVLELKRR